MGIKIVDVTLHVDEETSPAERELLRGNLLNQDGVMSADSCAEKTHLFVVKYDPSKVQSYSFLKIAENQGLNAELIGL